MIGADADIVLWDTRRKVTINNAALHHEVDYTPYEGKTVQGWPVLTLSHGKVVSKDQTFVGTAGDGQFLPCGTPSI
jgi:dihydropyrimidinase